jgi:SSS family solute:Na+ symporter
MKIYTARSIRTLKLSIVFYPTFQIFLIPILFIGFSGILRFDGVTPADTILPTVLMALDLPPAVIGLFCAGALAASMSTGDSLLHAAGSVLVKDFYRPLFRPEGSRRAMSDGAQTRAIRVMVVAISAVAYYIAVASDLSLVLMLLLAYGFIAQIFPVAVVTFLWPRATPQGVLAGVVSGCLAAVVWNLVPALQWQGIHPGIWALGVNVAVMIGVSLATPPMDDAHVEQFVVR